MTDPYGLNAINNFIKDKVLEPKQEIFVTTSESLRRSQKRFEASIKNRTYEEKVLGFSLK